MLPVESYDDHLGALDISDEGHAEINGHSSSTVPVGRQTERRHSPGAPNPHGQVDDQVEHLVAQVVGHGDHLAGNVAFLLDEKES